jgi:hypothetical protein
MIKNTIFRGKNDEKCVKTPWFFKTHHLYTGEILGPKVTLQRCHTGLPWLEGAWRQFAPALLSIFTH